MSSEPIQASIPKMLKRMDFLEAQIRDRDDQIKKLHEMLEQSLRERAENAEGHKVQDENEKLKHCIMEALSYMPIKIPTGISLAVPEDKEASFAEQSPYFLEIQKRVLECVIEMVKVRGESVHYDQVTAFYRNRYRGQPVKSETIRRRLQILREQGYLASPNRGEYIPGPKCVDLLKAPQEIGGETMVRTR